jgi:transposase
MAKPLLPDDLWEIIRPLLPPAPVRPPGAPGRPRVGDREALTGILFVLKTGIPWEDLPVEMGCGSGMTCWRRLRDWQAAGVWGDLHQELLRRLDDSGKIDWSRAAVDSSFARAYGGAADSGPSPVDRGHPGVKHHVLVDANGVPLAVDTTPANVPEVKRLIPLVDAAGPLDEDTGGPGGRPGVLYGDRGYDSEPHRQELRDRGIEPKLAKRRTAHGSGLGVYRWVVERFFAWAHGLRKLRLVTERTDETQLAFLNLACAVICFRFL